MEKHILIRNYLSLGSESLTLRITKSAALFKLRLICIEVPLYFDLLVSDLIKINYFADNSFWK